MLFKLICGVVWAKPRRGVSSIFFGPSLNYTYNISINNNNKKLYATGEGGQGSFGP